MLADLALHNFHYDARDEKEEITIGSTASEVVSRFIARESSATSDPNPAAIAATVLQRISANLSRFIGSDGCHALLMRSLARARATHPAVNNIRIIAQPHPSLDGVPESIQRHGATETAAALESTLTALIELLGRLIGDELAMRLLEQNPADVASPNSPRLAQ